MPVKESTIVRKIREALIQRGAAVVKIHGSAFQPDAVDLLGCYRGRALAIEVKRPGKEPTPRQAEFLERWRRAGGIAFWATSKAEAIAKLEGGTVDHMVGRGAGSQS